MRLVHDLNMRVTEIFFFLFLILIGRFWYVELRRRATLKGKVTGTPPQLFKLTYLGCSLPSF